MELHHAFLNSRTMSWFRVTLCPNKDFCFTRCCLHTSSGKVLLESKEKLDWKKPTLFHLDSSLTSPRPEKSESFGTPSPGEKEYVKAVYCHPASLIYMQSVSCEMLGWMNHNLESRLLGEISTTSDMQMISLQWQKVKRN